MEGGGGVGAALPVGFSSAAVKAKARASSRAAGQSPAFLLYLVSLACLAVGGSRGREGQGDLNVRFCTPTVPLPVPQLLRAPLRVSVTIGSRSGQVILTTLVLNGYRGLLQVRVMNKAINQGPDYIHSNYLGVQGKLFVSLKRNVYQLNTVLECLKYI